MRQIKITLHAEERWLERIGDEEELTAAIDAFPGGLLEFSTTFTLRKNGTVFIVREGYLVTVWKDGKRGESANDDSWD